MIPYIHSNDTLWVAEYKVTETQLYKEAYLRCAVRPKYKARVEELKDKNIMPVTGRMWRYAKIDGEFYYDWEWLPLNARVMLPTYNELMELANSLSYDTFLAEVKAAINNNYSHYVNYYASKYPLKFDSLTKTAAYLEYVFLQKNNEKYPICTLISYSLKGICDLNLSHFAPNKIALNDWFTMLNDNFSIVDLIKLRGENNKNAQKYEDNEVREWLVNLRIINNYTDSYIARKIQDECYKANKRCPSMRWLTGYLQQNQIKYITSEKRYGKDSRFAIKNRAYTPLATALHAGDCWEIDGTRVNMLAHKAAEGEKSYLYQVVVRDVHSGAALGYDFDTVEDRWVVTNALKAAVETAQYLPFEIRCDKFPGHNTPEVIQLFKDLELRGVKITITSTAWGKARLERWFNTLQTVFMQEHQYYYGEGVKSRNNYAHRSKEYLAKMRKDAANKGWNFDQAANDQGSIIEKFNTTALSRYSRKFAKESRSPIQLHIDSDKPLVRPVDNNTIVYLFGLKKKLQIKNEGLLQHEVQGVTLNYRISDYDVIANHNEVLVCYTYNDLSKVEVYEINAKKPILKHLCTANEIPVIQLYGDAPQYDELQKQKAIIKEIQQKREAALKQAVGAAPIDETVLLYPTLVSKHEAESVETEYIDSTWNNAQPQQENNSNESYDLRDEY